MRKKLPDIISIVSYGYDHTDSRMYLKDNATTTYFAGPHYEFTQGGYQTYKHVRVGGELVASVVQVGSTVSTLSLLTDQIGSTGVTTNAGTPAQDHDYFPFGNLRSNRIYTGPTAQRKVGSQVLKEMRVDIPLLSVVKDEKHKAKAILGDKKLSLAHKQAILRANLESHRFAVQYHRRLREKL